MLHVELYFGRYSKSFLQSCGTNSDSKCVTINQITLKSDRGNCDEVSGRDGGERTGCAQG